MSKGKVEYINPTALNTNPAFTNVVVVSGSVKTIYIGGQGSINAEHQIVGKGDLKAQVEQVLKNIEIALEAGGAKLEHVIKWNIYLVQGQALPPSVARQGFWQAACHFDDVRCGLSQPGLPRRDGRHRRRPRIAVY